MRIIVAKNIGFCFGVRRALDMAEELSRTRERLYTLGALIHNRQVIESLEKKGIFAVESPEDAPGGATVLVRSHGVPPETLEACRARGLDVADATCPFVERIHRIVREQSGKGRRIAIFGEPGHPECVGINGCCGYAAIFLKNAEDIYALDPAEPLCVVAQTTADAAGYEGICSAAASHMQDALVMDT
ncbi:MAG TPA: 4-hydroxy-3-methylbut-2-enyl diphosphate reductase, partial [Clostridia bacterium]|nr:4-hydroxy-3-methylbut-2-enyl diphosphate reductase [Clostridia bacterium]